MRYFDLFIVEMQEMEIHVDKVHVSDSIFEAKRYINQLRNNVRMFECKEWLSFQFSESIRSLSGVSNEKVFFLMHLALDMK
jgi:uncharacterized protein YPO0396